MLESDVGTGCDLNTCQALPVMLDGTVLHNNQHNTLGTEEQYAQRAHVPRVSSSLLGSSTALGLTDLGGRLSRSLSPARAHGLAKKP